MNARSLLELTQPVSYLYFLPTEDSRRVRESKIGSLSIRSKTVVLAAAATAKSESWARPLGDGK